MVVVAAGLALLAGPAAADWDEGDFHKMHFPQLPDLDKTGVDVDTTWAVLADDFKCSQTGLITDIHIWGSFADDILPVNGVDWMCFNFSIHADIPDPDGDGPLYSMPGELLWSTGFCGPQHGPDNGFTYRLYADGIEEWWYDPATGLCYFPGDHECYQYNFYINPEEAFEQQEGTIYWLDVQARAVCEDASFGWKSSLNHYNDDAVYWAQDPSSGQWRWFELRYPVDCSPEPHPYAGQSMDLAFVITPEPGTLALFAVAGMGLLRRREKRR